MIYDMTALGELLIDFAMSPGSNSFECNPGGAPANFLTAASHMGCRTAFIGKVGDDMFADLLKETLEREHIDTAGLVKDERFFTTLAFVKIDENGERDFSFARKPGADTRLEYSDIDESFLKDTKIFHFGSLSLTDEPARSATLRAVRTAKEAGAIISYDPNYRASLWKSEEEAKEAILEALPLADAVKVSLEEAVLLTGCSDPLEASKALKRHGARLVAVTLGDGGVFLDGPKCTVTVASEKKEAVDTTGAGDTFWGSFLAEFVLQNSSKEKEALMERLCKLELDELEHLGRIGNAAAGLCVAKKGGIPSIPTADEVRTITQTSL